MAGPTPALNAMLVCDTIICDQRSGRSSIINIFNYIRGSSEPVRMARLAVYARVTDAQGQYVFKLELVNLKDMQIVGSQTSPAPIGIEDRMAVYELAFFLQNVIFHAVGPYEFRLYADGKFVGNHSFVVVVPAKKEEHDEQE